jgi:hypothetical protein
MKVSIILVIALFTSMFCALSAQELYKAPEATTHTRWISPENPTGEKGKGGLTNKGAKGNAFYIVQPGETKTIFDVKGAGIIEKMWMSGSIGNSKEQRRAVRLDMYWDGALKPAVSAPIGDFFGMAHGLTARYDNEFFSTPEARSFNFTIPMPFRKSGLITITNESSSEVWIWYDINYLEMKKLPKDAMYFHAYWNRSTKTTLGEDYVILPKVEGRGRFLGTNIGVIGDPLYNGTWFGEGEVKAYLDGDKEKPTLVGTGTEDYIGTGWGQGEYASRYFGSPISNEKSDIYAFYRYHVVDPIYFHDDCKITIQQIGNQKKSVVLKAKEKGAELIPVWYVGSDGKKSHHVRILDQENPIKMEDKDFPETHMNFYRRDDVCATAYFYLDKPENNLPALPPVELRLKDLKEKVWDKIK